MTKAETRGSISAVSSDPQSASSFSEKRLVIALIRLPRSLWFRISDQRRLRKIKNACLLF